MALKQVLDNAEAARRMRADILMSSGSYAAVEALAYVAMTHHTQAVRDADNELADHWMNVHLILAEAKNKIGALT